MRRRGTEAQRHRGTVGLRALCLSVPLCLCASVPLLSQCPDGTPPPCAARGTAPAVAGANSVGVLLFNNQTHDTAYAYLSDGLATEIATSLAQVPRLEVRSPGAVRSAQRGGVSDPAVMGRRLNVRYIVEGDYQRGGDRIRISVRLVALPSGTQRWSEAYTRPITDLLAVQEEIASAVATSIAGQLLPQERRVLAARPTTNPEAYDHVLRGNFQLARRTPGGVLRGIEEFTEAARLDPSYAQAQARIALGYALFLDWGWDLPGVSADSQLVLGERAADRALALDSMSSDGWMSFAYLRAFRYPVTLDGVLGGLDRATRLDPRNAEAWHQYSSWLISAGRYDDGIAAGRRALVIEPSRAVSWLNLSAAYEALHQAANATMTYDSAIAIDPEMYVAFAYRTFQRVMAGDLAGARADADAAMRFSPASEAYYGLAPLAAVAAASGDTTAARQYTARMMEPFRTRPISPLVSQMLGMGLVAAGQRAEALDMLERTQPIGGVFWVSLQAMRLQPLTSDPRFQRLLEQSRPRPR